MPRGPNRRISSWAEESSLRYLEAKTRIDLHVAICIRWEREITVIIEGRSNATNVMSSRGRDEDTAPPSVISCRRENEMAFFDMARSGFRGETKSLDGI